MKEFATPAALKLIRREKPGERPSGSLENYFPPMFCEDDEVIFCTTDEREDFEEQKEIALTSERIDDQFDYDALVRFLTEDYQLQEI